MFLLRRHAVRALSAPSKKLFVKPRSLTTFTHPAPALRQQKWSIALLQRRWASDETIKHEATAAEIPDDFAQTAAEAPIEDGLTPAQQEVQADPKDSANTINAEALSQVDDAAKKVRRTTGPRPSERSNPPNKILYIGNLFYEVTADQLKRVFSRFGEIKNTRIIHDDRGLSRGFGYVEFDSIDDAQAAIDNLDMQVFEGRNLVVQFHRARSETRSFPSRTYTEQPPSSTLFLGNMSFEMSDKDLNDLFRDIPNVHDVRVAIDRRTGQPRGFAHADFTDVASATKGKELLTGRVIYGRELRIDFGKPPQKTYKTNAADSDVDATGQTDGEDVKTVPP